MAEPEDTVLGDRRIRHFAGTPKWTGKFVFTIIAGVATVIVLVAVFIDLICGAAVLASFLLGCVCVHLLLRQGEQLPNICFWLSRKSKAKPFQIARQCVVCGKIRCKRHRPEFAMHNLKPWAELMVPKEVDNALEEIMNLILKEHVYPWYRELSTDEGFVQELRIAFRFLAATLLRRAQQVDLVSLILDKVLKAALQHIDAFVHGKRRARSARNIEQAVLGYYGDHLHVALQSRTTEVQYLRHLVELVQPHIMLKKHMTSKLLTCLVQELLCGTVLLIALDTIADPDIVNSLLVLFFDKNPMTDYPESTEPPVELLSNFVSSVEKPYTSGLYTELKTLLNNQQLLFPFMQFLKEETAVNILQFCLSVDDFNCRILNPDLTKEDLEILHKEAKEMYNTYFTQDAVDRIPFEPDIVEEIREVVNGDPQDVVKLRTTAPLYRAYEHAYGLLENIYCPLFHQSEMYFALICGRRWSAASGRNSGKANKKGNESTVSKLGHKIKGVLWTPTDEGKFFDFSEETATDLSETLLDDSTLQLVTDDEVKYKMEDDPRLKDLSAWRVSIPRVETRMDLNCKYYHVFIIEVQRIDVRDSESPEDTHWTVERRYHEFYVLEGKLREFHGELSDISLPPKRSFGNKNKQFMEARRAAFEKFLQALLSHPSLRGSELLYAFLKSSVEFTTGFLPEINLGKMIKTVPMKLLKEKGQHLEPFLQAFIASTEAAKPKPSKMEWRELHEPPPTKAAERMTMNPLFGDNTAQWADSPIPGSGATPTGKIRLDGIYDYIIFVAVRVFNAPLWCLQLLLMAESIVRQTLHTCIEWYLERKLRLVLSPQRIADIIHHLRDVIFFNHDPPRTGQQKAQRARLALQKAKKFLPDILVKALGQEKHEEGILLLFSLLQYPLLNKQLSYVLLDIVMLELFPELQSKGDTPSEPASVDSPTITITSEKPSP